MCPVECLGVEIPAYQVPPGAKRLGGHVAGAAEDDDVSIVGCVLVTIPSAQIDPAHVVVPETLGHIEPDPAHGPDAGQLQRLQDAVPELRTALGRQVSHPFGRR
jgi:hypothetical protein